MNQSPKCRTLPPNHAHIKGKRQGNNLVPGLRTLTIASMPYMMVKTTSVTSAILPFELMAKKTQLVAIVRKMNRVKNVLLVKLYTSTRNRLRCVAVVVGERCFLCEVLQGATCFRHVHVCKMWT